MSTSRGPRGRAAGLSRSAPRLWMASGSAADTSRRVPPDSSDNSPPLVPTPPSGILLVLAPFRPRGPGAEGEVAGREVLSRVRTSSGGRGRAARGGGTGGAAPDRILRLAARLRDRAAGAEPAPGRDAQRARRVPGNGRAAVVRGALGHPGD